MTHDPKLIAAIEAAIIAAIRQHDMSDSQLYWMGGPEPSEERSIIATAALDAIEAAGCVVVPREPTWTMMAQGGEAHEAWQADRKERRGVGEAIWTAMVAARPGAQP